MVVEVVVVEVVVNGG